MFFRIELYRAAALHSVSPPDRLLRSVGLLATQQYKGCQRGHDPFHCFAPSPRDLIGPMIRAPQSVTHFANFIHLIFLDALSTIGLPVSKRVLDGIQMPTILSQMEIVSELISAALEEYYSFAMSFVRTAFYLENQLLILSLTFTPEHQPGFTDELLDVLHLFDASPFDSVAGKVGVFTILKRHNRIALLQIRTFRECRQELIEHG
jgi:hypothetical protein